MYILKYTNLSQIKKFNFTDIFFQKFLQALAKVHSNKFSFFFRMQILSSENKSDRADFTDWMLIFAASLNGTAIVGI